MAKNKSVTITQKELDERREKLQKQPFKSFFTNNINELEEVKKRVRILEEKQRKK